MCLLCYLASQMLSLVVLTLIYVRVEETILSIIHIHVQLTSAVYSDIMYRAGTVISSSDITAISSVLTWL